MNARMKIDTPIFVILVGLILLMLTNFTHAADVKRVSAQEGSSQTVKLLVGRQTFVETDRKIKRAALGDAAVGQVLAVNSREVRLLGLAPGRTNLSIWVVDRTQTTGERRMSWPVHVLPDLRGLSKIFAREKSLSRVKVEADGGRVVLFGRTPSDASKEQALTIAKHYAGDSVIDLIRVDGKRMVSVEIKFAAVSSGTLKALGVDFKSLGRDFIGATTAPNSITNLSFSGGPTGASLGLNAGIPIAEAFNILLGSPGSNFLSVISALNGTDFASILAEPTLQVRSGEKANFLAGGEIPIPVPQGGNSGGVSIEYKPFGVKLDIEPTVTDEGMIMLKVAPEVSELDFANALTLQGFNVPAFRVRSTSTMVELADGQSFILAGLQMENQSNVEEKIPGLGEIPILGAFFKRSRQQKEKQELVIVATPRLVSAQSMPMPGELPGAKMRGYDQSVADMLLNTHGLDDELADHGMMP